MCRNLQLEMKNKSFRQILPSHSILNFFFRALPRILTCGKSIEILTRLKKEGLVTSSLSPTVTSSSLASPVTLSPSPPPSAAAASPSPSPSPPPVTPLRRRATLEEDLIPASKFHDDFLDNLRRLLVNKIYICLSLSLTHTHTHTKILASKYITIL